MSEQSGDSQQRRQYKRKAYHTSAELLLPNRKPIAVRTLDISVGGMGLVVSHNLLAGDYCLIRLPLPIKPNGRLVCEIESTVVHSVFSSGIRRAKVSANLDTAHASRDSVGAFKVGIEFSALKEHVAKAIIQFVNS